MIALQSFLTIQTLSEKVYNGPVVCFQRSDESTAYLLRNYYIRTASSLYRNRMGHRIGR
jgi:hypothetical protein